MNNNSDSRIKHFVINLERRPDRLELFQKRLPKILESQVQCFRAVDGKKIDPEMASLSGETGEGDLKMENLQNALVGTKKLNRGEIGCFLSHSILWQKLLEEKTCEFYFIFEDDAVFEPDFEEAYQVFQKEVLDRQKQSEEEQKQGYLLYFGGRFTSRFITKKTLLEPRSTNTSQQSAYSIHSFKRNLTSNFFNAKHFDRTTHAYVIDKKGAQFLVDSFQKSDRRVLSFQTNLQVDHYMRHIMSSHNVSTLVPLACYSEINHDSDIQI